jgi:hypothetical protein
MFTSITPEQIKEQKHNWPRDRYIVRHVNGRHDQHWSVSDAGT